jgi:hypothetical protein
MVTAFILLLLVLQAAYAASSFKVKVLSFFSQLLFTVSFA